MFLFFYFSLLNSLKPLFLFPGIYGSNLIATASHYSSLWYCPVEIDHEIIWFNHKYLVPPFFNCLFELLQCDFDEKSGEITALPGVHIDVQDFGGDQSLTYVDHGLGDIHVIKLFNGMFTTFKNLGYELHKDLFGIPYDWRLAVSGFDSTSFYEKIKLKIEKAFKFNNQKVTLFGHSCGGLVIHHFLTSFVDDEWKSQYVEKVIFLAPALTGSSISIQALWKQVIPLFPFLKSDKIKEIIQRIPALYSMIPNYEVFENIPLIYAPKNQKILPKDFPEFLTENAKIQKVGLSILNKSLPLIKSAPGEIGLPVYLMYNDAFDTLAAYNMSDGITDDPSEIYMPGDKTLTSFGQEYPCHSWSNKSTIVCHNFHMKDSHFSHSSMQSNPYIEHLIFNLTNNDDWYKISGKTKIIGPYIEFSQENNSFAVRTDIRDKVVSALD